MAVGLVVDYMVHIVHYFLHQVRVLPVANKKPGHLLSVVYTRRASCLRVHCFCSAVVAALCACSFPLVSSMLL